MTRRAACAVIVALAALVVALPGQRHAAQAQTAGPATVAIPAFDRQKALDEIFRDLAAAPNETASRIIADRMWLIFMQAPDAQAAEDMNRALRARGGYNFEKALTILDGMIARHPTYAEAWNQRAYIHFLQENYERSLADCERTLELEPRHVGCLSGMARILIRKQKRYRAGEGLLRRAMKLHPFIYERILLEEIPQQDL